MGIDNKGAYAPPQETEDTFDAKLEGGGRGPLLLAVAALVLAAFVAAVWGAYKKGVRKGGREAPPVIVASSEPYKVKPKNPGGEVVPNQDKEIYNIIDESTDHIEKTVKIRPLPETPINRKTEQSSRPEHVGVKADIKTSGEKPALRRTREANNKSIAVPKTILKKKTASKTISGTPLVKGGYAIQIAAYRTNSSAAASWKILQKKYASILSGSSHEVKRVDLGKKGVYYRLRATGYSDHKSALNVCHRLKKSGQDCLVIKR